MKGNLLKKGDKVVMHTCLESEGKNYGKIWTCKTDEFVTGKKPYEQNLVFLEGFSGSFSTEYLQKVIIEQKKDEDSCYASCEDCDYNTEAMPFKELLYKLSEEGGYIISDKEGGCESKCPKCGGENLSFQVD